MDHYALLPGSVHTEDIELETHFNDLLLLDMKVDVELSHKLQDRFWLDLS